MAAIEINGNLVEPDDQCEGGSQYTPDASGSNYIVVQFEKLLSPEQHAQLVEEEVILQNYLGAETYIAHYRPRDLDKVRRLDFVKYANVYHPDLVTDHTLRHECGVHPDSASYATAGESAGTATSEPPAERRFDILVLLHDNPERNVEQLKEALVQQLNLDEGSVELGENRFKVFQVNAEKIQRIAREDEVKAIQEVAYAVTANHVSREDLEFMDYKSLDKTITPDIYDAERIIVAVGDTGFDIASLGDQHPAIKPRLVDLVVENPDHPGGADEWGHGTHVAGSVASNHASIQFGTIKGTAPRAEIFFQAMAFITPHPVTGADRSGLLMVPTGNAFWQNALNKPAYIHTNSWGSGTVPDPTDPTGINRLQRAYDAAGSIASDVDNFMRTNKEFLVLFAGGNEGEEAPVTDTHATVGAHATAKNCITVGACESSKPMDYRYHYLEGGGKKGNRNKIAKFSNIGPTRNTIVPPGASNSRFKPDVVAPGTIIYSALSRFGQSAVPPIPLKWHYDNKTGTSQPTNADGQSPDPLWAFMSGTSMATPLVAGCCAVVRKVALSKVTPGTVVTATLVKAAIINGAVDINEGKDDPALTHPPAIDQGFGRVNITNSLNHFTDDKHCGWLQGAPLIATAPNNIKRIQINIPDTPYVLLKPVLRATMAYNDRADVSLVNTLIFSAVVPARGGTPAQTRFGNTMHPTNRDEVNNVQKVIWSDIPPGAAELVVECTALRLPALAPDQDFSVVWWVDYVKTDGADAVLYTLAGLGVAAAVAIGILLAT